ncbi:hypothetical protein ACH41H_48190 [Streptomyces sp. NPDC020800]|uniref:hypothetical protein n=1 Tax=Streptomyces sp. NPDC020800 TaxID=3365092 RepID=UPI00379465A7
MEIAREGAAALVTEMARTTWESVRAAVARFFSWGGEEGVDQELRLIDGAQQRLADARQGERAAVEDRLRGELVIQLAAFMLKHPEAAQELRDLAGQVQGAGEGSGARTSVHNNTNSQVVIADGSINASGGFHYGTAGGGQ